MGTSNIVLERVQAILRTDTGDGSVHDHLVRVVRKLIDEKPEDALAQLEKLSRQLKGSSFTGSGSLDDEQPVILDAAAEAAVQRWCGDVTSLVRPPNDSPADKQSLAAVRNFLDDAAMFAWAGVGFGQQESFHIAMSLRRLASEAPGLKDLKLWGKILGQGGDYLVAEGTLKMPEGAEAPPPAMPDTPEYDVEPVGEGNNLCTYWVSEGVNAPWVRLPFARASHILAAKKIKRLMTGNLESPVLSMPWFPGKERHLLRSQIARIAATTTLALDGFYEKVEDSETKIIQAAEPPGAPDSIQDQAAWVHCRPVVLPNGKTTWLDLEGITTWYGKVEDEDPEKKTPLTPDDEAQLQNFVDNVETAQTKEENPASVLGSITEDLQTLKAEDDSATWSAWSVKTHGDEGIYGDGDGARTYLVTSLRSMIWPGAVTVAQGSKFASIYIGYGLKTGVLVPTYKNGLPLEGTSPFTSGAMDANGLAFNPVVPADIMSEPEDLPEEEEPNPRQEDVESEGDEDKDPQDL